MRKEVLETHDVNCRLPIVEGKMETANYSKHFSHLKRVNVHTASPELVYFLQRRLKSDLAWSGSRSTLIYEVG